MNCGLQLEKSLNVFQNRALDHTSASKSERRWSFFHIRVKLHTLLGNELCLKKKDRECTVSSVPPKQAPLLWAAGVNSDLNKSRVFVFVSCNSY